MAIEKFTGVTPEQDEALDAIYRLRYDVLCMYLLPQDYSRDLPLSGDVFSEEVFSIQCEIRTFEELDIVMYGDGSWGNSLNARDQDDRWGMLEDYALLKSPLLQSAHTLTMKEFSSLLEAKKNRTYK